MRPLREIRSIDLNGWMFAFAGELPSAGLGDLRAPTLALGREGPGVSNRPVDPLSKLLVGFQVLAADA